MSLGAAKYGGFVFLIVLVTLAGCNARLVIEPGGDSGDSDASAIGDVDHGDAPFCDNDAALEQGYCPPGWRCDVWQGPQYLWNVCCAPGVEAGEGCNYPSP